MSQNPASRREKWFTDGLMTAFTMRTASNADCYVITLSRHSYRFVANGSGVSGPIGTSLGEFVSTGFGATNLGSLPLSLIVSA